MQLTIEEKRALENPEHVGAGEILSLVVCRQQSEVERMQSTVSRYAEVANQAKRLLMLSVPDYYNVCLCHECLAAIIKKKV